METSDKWELTIPTELGYGSRVTGDVISPKLKILDFVDKGEIKSKGRGQIRNSIDATDPDPVLFASAFHSS